MMLKKIKIYSIGLMIALFCICPFATADTAADNALLLDSINQIRNAPFSHALSLGYEKTFLEERGILPETTFAPYVLSDFLSSRAVDDNSTVTGENTTSDENESLHLSTVETGGVVSFFNFMSLADANKIFVDNLFKNEIESNNFQYILSNIYSYAGISIKSGISSDQMNAWFYAIHLGSLVLKSEIQILNMINQVRSEPWSLQVYLDYELMNAIAGNINIFSLLGGEYSPVFFDSSLHASAYANSFYVFNGVYPAPLTSYMPPLARSLYYGYTGQSVQESMLTVVNPKENFITFVDTIFSSLVLNELKTWPENAMVFSNEFQDAGPGMSLRSGENLDRAVLSLDVGTNTQAYSDQSSRIYGIVFLNTDGNSLYAPGEEIAQQTIMVYDENWKFLKSVVSDNAGHFTLTLDANRNYYFRAVSDHYAVTQKIVLGKDRFVKMVCNPV